VRALYAWVGALPSAALRVIAVAGVVLSPATGAAAGQARVVIEGFVFSPAELQVRAGTTLVFVNRDRVPHSIVGERDGKEIFRSAEQIDEDDDFRIVLDTPGELALRCGIHSGIKARIIVTP